MGLVHLEPVVAVHGIYGSPCGDDQVAIARATCTTHTTLGEAESSSDEEGLDDDWPTGPSRVSSPWPVVQGGVLVI